MLPRMESLSSRSSVAVIPIYSKEIADVIDLIGALEE
jgi:hypothetical protein